MYPYVCLPGTYVSICVFALGAAAHVTDGSHVPLQETTLVVQDGDAVLLDDERQRRLNVLSRGIAVVICILDTQGIFNFNVWKIMPG